MLIRFARFLVLWINERLTYASGALHLVSLASIIGMMIYFWWKTIVSVIRAGRLKSLLAAKALSKPLNSLNNDTTGSVTP